MTPVQLEFECVPSNQLAFTLPHPEDLETVPVMVGPVPVRMHKGDEFWPSRTERVKTEGDVL